MALLKPFQCFSCSGVRLSSFLMRSILASLLVTICSAVSCGAPVCVSTAVCFCPFAALADFDLDASDLEPSDLELSDLELSDLEPSDLAVSFAASCFAAGCAGAPF